MELNLNIKYNNLKEQDEELKKKIKELCIKEYAFDCEFFKTKNLTNIQEKEFKIRKDSLEIEYKILDKEQQEINKKFKNHNLKLI